jgi:phosphate transport system substrate-binding protein
LNKYFILTVLVLSVVVCAGCDLLYGSNIESPVIQGLTLNNYPKVDGSTSTEPLNAIVACKVLGINYIWRYAYGDTRDSILLDLDNKNTDKFWRKIKSSQTHQSFINLINKDADLILTARKMSADEEASADAAGISLIETPIALDAFIFIVNEQNPVQSLTIKQVQDIYTGGITNWRQVGGNNEAIYPYVRNANSGSQELMETLVMKDLDIMNFPENSSELIFSMAGALDIVSNDPASICYTLYYYRERIANGTWNIKNLAINGIDPDWFTIGDRSYPYVAEIYAVIRSDLNKSSMAYKLYEWLQTEAGKDAILDSGYPPY